MRFSAMRFHTAAERQQAVVRILPATTQQSAAK
jgi:hypothetical protein